MALSLGVWLQIIVTIIVGVIGTITTLIFWYLRKYILTQVELNTKSRNFLFGSGTTLDQDKGYIEELDARITSLRNDMNEQHADVDQQLQTLERKVDKIVALLEEKHDTEIGRDR
jgi:flagellar biosynthesis chaperone FliJ